MISLETKGLPVIRGHRLYLRAVERDDLQRCHDWINDESLRATLAQRYPMSLAQEADWIERTARGQDPSKLTFAIMPPPVWYGGIASSSRARPHSALAPGP